MNNVVPIEDIGKHVEATISGIIDGVAALRAKGVQAELPTEVMFSMVVVGKWQALEIVAAETDTGTEKAGTADQSTKNSTADQTSFDDQAHDQQSEEKLYSTIS